MAPVWFLGARLITSARESLLTSSAAALTEAACFNSAQDVESSVMRARNAENQTETVPQVRQDFGTCSQIVYL
jgi:hypothetical protein